MISRVLQNGLCTEGVITKYLLGLMIRIVDVRHGGEMNDVIGVGGI